MIKAKIGKKEYNLKFTVGALEKFSKLHGSEHPYDFFEHMKKDRYEAIGTLMWCAVNSDEDLESWLKEMKENMDIWEFLEVEGEIISQFYDSKKKMSQKIMDSVEK